MMFIILFIWALILQFRLKKAEKCMKEASHLDDVFEFEYHLNVKYATHFQQVLWFVALVIYLLVLMLV